MHSRVVTAHIPDQLARKLDSLAERLERPREQQYCVENVSPGNSVKSNRCEWLTLNDSNTKEYEECRQPLADDGSRFTGRKPCNQAVAWDDPTCNRSKA